MVFSFLSISIDFPFYITLHLQTLLLSSWKVQSKAIVLPSGSCTAPLRQLEAKCFALRLNSTGAAVAKHSTGQSKIYKGTFAVDHFVTLPVTLYLFQPPYSFSDWLVLVAFVGSVQA